MMYFKLVFLSYFLFNFKLSNAQNQLNTSIAAEWSGYEELQAQVNNNKNDGYSLLKESTNSLKNVVGGLIPSGKTAKVISVNEAKFYTLFAGAAYCKIKEWDCMPYCKSIPGMTIKVLHVIRDDKYDIDGYIAYKNNDEIIVSIRGSKSLNNWLNNALIFQVPINLPSPYNNCKVHFGFNNAALAVLPQIGQVLKKQVQINPNVKISLVGHSLGGAIFAMLSHYLVADNYISFNQFQLITFGQPRVGDATYVKYINNNVKSITRITHATDLIPLIPPIGLNYLHFNNEMYIQGEGSQAKVKYCSNSIGEDPTCIINPLQIRSWPDHFKYWDVVFDKCE